MLLQSYPKPKPMRVAYTHDIFSRQSIGGISRYFIELIRHLDSETIETEVLVGKHSNELLLAWQRENMPVSESARSPSKSSPWTRLRNDYTQARQARHFQPDLVHHTYYTFTRPLRRIPLVLTIYDFIPELFPQEYGWKARFLSAAKRQNCRMADRILAISETTKADLVNHFGICPDRIDVTYLSSSIHLLVDPSNNSPLRQPYLLYVGKRSGYKNCRVLWEAFARSPILKDGLQVVCFGGGGFTHRERQLLNELNIADLVHQVSGNDRLLADYYQRAATLVLPSLYEGFGLPLVEAMNLGCLIVASTGGALPEIAGPAAVYFDPLDPDMLSDTLERLLYDTTAQYQLQQAMKQRAQAFSWKYTAKQTCESYQKAAA